MHQKRGRAIPLFRLFPAIAPKERDRWGIQKSPAALASARTHCRSSGTLVPSLHLKFDACSLFQSIEVESLKAAAVEEYFFALGSADKPEPTVTDDSLDSPLHGHLGKRMAVFALDRDKDGGLRVKSPHAPIGATLPPPERIVKGQTPLRRSGWEMRKQGGKKSAGTESPYLCSLKHEPMARAAPAPSGCGEGNRSPRRYHWRRKPAGGRKPPPSRPWARAWPQPEKPPGHLSYA
jgi:hypothetical protein